MIIMRAIPAHPQNNGDNPGSMVGCNAPTKPNAIIATRTNPNTSSIFAMFYYHRFVKSKRYMVL